MSKQVPAEVFPPGEFIREELEARGWTQEDLAQIMGRPVRLVNELVNAKKQITPDTARGLAEAFGTDALYWMNLDSAYRLSNTGPANESVSRRALLYDKFPIREMTKRCWIESSSNIDVLEHRVLRFHRIKSVAEKLKFAHAAKATQYVERTPVQWAWLFRAKQLSESVMVASYDKRKLRKAIQQLKALRIVPEEIRQVPSLLANAGVRFVIVEFLPGAKIDGAAFGLTIARQLLRYLCGSIGIDNFWFVLRHEIEHVLNRDGLMVDLELSEQIEGNDAPLRRKLRRMKLVESFAFRQKK